MESQKPLQIAKPAGLPESSLGRPVTPQPVEKTESAVIESPSKRDNDDEPHSCSKYCPCDYILDGTRNMFQQIHDSHNRKHLLQFQFVKEVAIEHSRQTGAIKGSIDELSESIMKVIKEQAVEIDRLRLHIEQIAACATADKIAQAEATMTAPDAAKPEIAQSYDGANDEVSKSSSPAHLLDASPVNAVELSNSPIQEREEAVAETEKVLTSKKAVAPEADTEDEVHAFLRTLPRMNSPRHSQDNRTVKSEEMRDRGSPIKDKAKNLRKRLSRMFTKLV